MTIVVPAISRERARNQLRREKTDALQRPVVSMARIAKIGWVEMTRQGPTKKDRGQPVRGSPRWAKLMSVLPPSAQNMLTGKNRGGEVAALSISFIVIHVAVMAETESARSRSQIIAADIIMS